MSGECSESNDYNTQYRLVQYHTIESLYVPRRNANWAVFVIESASSRIMSLNPELNDCYCESETCPAQ